MIAKAFGGRKMRRMNGSQLIKNAGSSQKVNCLRFLRYK